ncbi:MAG: acyloxyacyl hydrolase [Verrucomicrobia bacterium]|nr:acyloxyacyl hydrolase [Verrucomicrobiota bacterium]
MKKNLCQRAIATAVVTLCCILSAATAQAQQRAVVFGTEVKGDWSLETGSGVLFSNMRSKTLDGYTLVPASITASLKLDDPSDDEGWRRGYTEFAFRPYGMAVTHGPESRMVGFDFGPRYNFVQPGWRLVPFIGAMVGFGFANTQDYPNPAVPYGLGQDFCFEFTINLGVRYDINDTWYVRFMAEYVHFSNAGLSEPARQNRAIDAIGPQLSVGCRF